MFKIAVPNQSVALSKSESKKIKQSIVQHYPDLEPYINDILPKGSMQQIKSKDVKTIGHGEKSLFFEHYKDWLPTLPLLHQYPFLKHVQVDKGAIKFILSGAHIMCPGLTGDCGYIDDTLVEGDIVAVRCEGKTLEIAIGKLVMSPSDIKEKNNGEAIHILHVLGDDLWQSLVKH